MKIFSIILCGMSILRDVLPVEGAMWYAELVRAFPCRIFSTGTMKTQVKEEESGLPAWWTDIRI